ncbi:hypothetical protein FH972_026288 [Carpinus fangiana]|uniref:non-specific serine/threonine protein kinase n=1 Tax=Carpinus fangiana TaxID=176857 RepID=A0A5N6L646_9ROSI|nr:hypothetical protein FH972_026288 [Carpinus fangiana]
MRFTLLLPPQICAGLSSRTRVYLPIPTICGLGTHTRRSRSVSTSTKPSTKEDEKEEGGIRYNYIEDVENLHYYTYGGMHPVSIGDCLKRRYRILHKLGFGTFSTTWLARDTLLGRLVAVKIARADEESNETRILSMLNETQRVKSGCGDASEASPIDWLIPPLLDTFEVEGPNGKHLCYATEPADCSLSDTKMGGHGGIFRLDVGRVLAAQLACAVSLVHARDLHLGNVLLRSRHKLDELSDEDIYSQFGAPELEEIVRTDGKPLPLGVPKHSVSMIWMGKSYKDVALADARISLADFGASFAPSQEARYYSQAPRVVRPPEVRFEPTNPVSYSADIWTLGCVFWDMLAWSSPFNNFFGDEDETTFQQVDTLGPLPVSWWEKWKARDEYFTAQCTPTKGRNPLPLNQRFEVSSQEIRKERGWPVMSSEEKRAFLSMIRSMFSFIPEDRPNIQQVIGSEWMQEWALPEYRKLRADFTETD